MKPIAFRGFNLQGGPYRVTDSGDLFNSPQRTIISEELARSDNAVAVFRRYGSRTFTLPGAMQAATSDSLEQAIDALKLNLMNQSGSLTAGWAGGTRYWDAECMNVVIGRAATDVTLATWSAQFFMAMAFATDGTTQTLATATAATLGSQLLGVNNIGTYLALPYITLTLTNIDPNITPVTLSIGNPASSEYLSITDTFTDGDIVVIDTINKQVFRNSELLNPSGHFPAWAPGPGLLDYSDTGSARTLNILATYNPRYL